MPTAPDPQAAADTVTMGSIAKEVDKNGSVERLLGSQYVPPLLDGTETGVSSKDITVSLNPLISARVFLPKLDKPQAETPHLGLYHGGGFCIESAFSSDHHRHFNSLVSQAKVVAVSVDYRMAPEHSLPVAYEEAELLVPLLMSPG